MKNDIAFYTISSKPPISWPDDNDARLAKSYLETLLQKGVRYAIKNATADFALLKINNKIIPVTISDFIAENTYVCSIYTQYINYAAESLGVIKNSFFRKLSYLFLMGMGKFLKLGKIDKCIHVNNWLLPTNIYAPLSSDEIKDITKFLSKKFPEHAILFRTLNFTTDRDIINNLRKIKYFLIGSRQIYILNKEKLRQFKSKKPNDLRKDEHILSNSGYALIDANTLNLKNMHNLTELYKSLYLDKHSYLNPQFTTRFIHLLAHSSMFSIKVLKKENSFDAFIGCLSRQDISYAPLFGYNTALPIKLGLYRMLSAIKINMAIDKDTILHSSAGAGTFKRNRGHESVPEYHAVQVQHLSYGRRLMWFFLKCIVNHIGMPLIERYDR